MNYQEIIIKKIKSLIKDPNQKIESTTPLRSSGLLESLAILELVTFLESEFQISLTAEDLFRNKFETVLEIETLLYKKVS